jgi:rsbT antagonist protein RsbS
MMNVPILRLGRILLTSIQSDLNDEQALRLQTGILKLFADGAADGVVIDVTAVDVIDSYMARILNETARMVGIMGGEAVLTGMPPTVAVTLVEMGRDIVGVETALNLEMGVEKLKILLARRRARGAPAREAR